MNTKILILLVALITMSIPIVQAADIEGNQPTPANINVIYNINTVTTFVVHTVSADGSMNFTANRDGKLIEPVGQNKDASPPIAWATIENRGEVAQTFKVKLAAVNTGTTIYVSNFSIMTPQITLSTTAQTPSGWSNVPACAQPCSDGTNVSLYARANFTNAPGGTGTLTIST